MISSVMAAPDSRQASASQRHSRRKNSIRPHERRAGADPQHFRACHRVAGQALIARPPPASRRSAQRSTGGRAISSCRAAYR
jgi:hypothetical protein